ncbi:MAG: hypothetical protein KF852_19465 [Saprospiraceae bacterium]|nr:hypothetical protein [Saprospiraceae bacterium]
MALFELLATDVNSEKNKDFERENVWKLLMLPPPYDDVRFRKYYSDLLKLVEGFLCQQIYESNPVQQASDLILAVGKKKMEKLYNSTMKTARRLSQDQPFRHAQHHLQQYLIELNYYYMMEYETKRGERTNVEEIANNLDAFYLAEKLRIYSSVLTQQHFVSQEYKVKLIDEIVEHLRHNDYRDTPSVAVYFQIFRTVSEQDKFEHYFKLKELLDQYGLMFPKDEALTIYYSAINYCIRQINHGNLQFNEELFDLYNDLINKEIIFVNDELSPWTFRNIVVIANRLGRYDWTENFIMTYSRKIPEAYRENAVTYNLAQLYFYQKKYDKVIEQLRNVEYEDVSYNLNSKIMLLTTYYETDELEPLYSLFDSLRTYINRQNNIPKDRKENYKNLIKFTKKLTRIMPGDDKALQKLKEEIATTGNVASLNWLQEKIEELS